MPEPNIKNKDKTTDIFCMPFRDFLESIKTQAGSAPETEPEEPDTEEPDAENAPPKLTLEMT